ncbi:MAG: hypothetical protein NXI31_13900 [bacterium]|nr:hypothetical protein [bacterium]
MPRHLGIDHALALGREQPQSTACSMASGATNSAYSSNSRRSVRASISFFAL